MSCKPNTVLKPYRVWVKNPDKNNQRGVLSCEIIHARTGAEAKRIIEEQIPGSKARTAWLLAKG